MSRCELTGKVMFYDEGAAERAITKIALANLGRDFRHPIRFYMCEECNTYHLTHHKSPPINTARKIPDKPVHEFTIVSRLRFLQKRNKL
jgi:uncharacterized protein YlaI